ncbi:phosphoglycerate mutase [Rhizobium sp. Leaf384]|uniref:histidine phosphatase family protein n=1 Tax=unclassified Rhizobium TaxID=2613769 RepID=UPI0007150A4C|nr:MULTISPECIES: histidine phosphatase family protein [unclassified Rhizobium]KQR77991.1 phosphoglycerate mutase [Rhizobium sp. Leaf341]KQS81204.1 phosphoglycerate mutase [Rhizobium sp. Leaf384]KQS87113.1 phosphoglycerate mutase [Rhizobium sp. Leaf383]
MFGLYISHPEVSIDPDVPIPRWGLSERGRARAGVAAQAGWARRLGRIVSSDETKALETAGILADVSGAIVEVLENAGENDRSATGFLPSAAFEAAADSFFAKPSVSFRGWETADDAQARIVQAVTTVLDTHDPTVPIAFIGHGGVGTLLYCHLSGLPISRAHDQGPGGGHLFAFPLRAVRDRSEDVCETAFSLARHRPVCKWTRIEDWQGWTDG